MGTAAGNALLRDFKEYHERQKKYLERTAEFLKAVLKTRGNGEVDDLVIQTGSDKYDERLTTFMEE